MHGELSLCAHYLDATEDPPMNPAKSKIPNYRCITSARQDLRKSPLTRYLQAQLEDQIHRFEHSYLEETTAGNIIKGFDNYIKGSASSSSLGASGLGLGSGVGGRRKAAVTDADRVFSKSSASYMMVRISPFHKDCQCSRHLSRILPALRQHKQHPRTPQPLPRLLAVTFL